MLIRLVKNKKLNKFEHNKKTVWYLKSNSKIKIKIKIMIEPLLMIGLYLYKLVYIN